MYNTAPTLTQYYILGKVPNHFHFKTKQGPQHWHKLPIHITFITQCQSTRESGITINNRKHSSYFSSIWIKI